MMATATSPQYRTEHVAETPRGWKVRMKVPGPKSEHLVAIAFPPGRRKKGSGRLVEILHPSDERNPAKCELSRTARKNPQELLVFGNPAKRSNQSFREVLKEGSRQAVISKDAEGTKYHVYPYVNYGETMVKSLGSFVRLETARQKAKQWLSGAGRKPSKRRNPDAVESFQSFHGRDPEEILRPHLSNIMRKEYFAIGPLLAIGLDDAGWSAKRIVDHWDQLPGITFSENEGVKLAAAPPDNGAKKSKQLYVIGGNQDLAGCLRNFEGVDATKDFIDLGDAYFVTYVARKIHDDYQETTYTHVLGEETGVRPRLFWDRLRKQLFFAGGEYFIDLNGISPGIEN